MRSFVWGIVAIMGLGCTPLGGRGDPLPLSGARPAAVPKAPAALLWFPKVFVILSPALKGRPASRTRAAGVSERGGRTVGRNSSGGAQETLNCRWETPESS